MERVVYWLGAGFSAPLGLPVTRDFLFRSKDQFARDTETYRHFSHVFSTLDDLAATKNYFAADLFNIEEVLSLLEMRDALGGDESTDEVQQYLKDVITYYTPEIVYGHDGVMPGNWHDWVFGDAPFREFGSFVASLLGVQIERTGGHGGAGLMAVRMSGPETKYDVVSLNYDLVLERFVEYIQEHFALSGGFNRTPDSTSSPHDANAPLLAKLHGSADGTVIPPTWSKALRPEIAEAWRAAFAILQAANHLRIVGYSLPANDTYVRYLLKAAVLGSSNLKSLDVICLDSDGSVERRFSEFIDFPYYRFFNLDVREYLRANLNALPKGAATEGRRFDRLELGHAEVVRRHGHG